MKMQAVHIQTSRFRGREPSGRLRSGRHRLPAGRTPGLLSRRDVGARDLAIDPLEQRGQDAAGADLVKGVEAVGEHPPHRLFPADALEHLGHERPADVVGVGVRQGIDVGVDRNPRALDGRSRQDLGKLLSAGFMRSEWKAPATARRTTFMAPSSVAIGSIASRAAASPETTMLPGPSMLAFQSRPCGATRRQSSSTFASSSPRTLVMPLGVASDAACIAWPRRRTTSRPAAKSIAPAKTSAVYSPRLSPAAPWQSSTTAGSLCLEALECRQAGHEDGRLAHVGRLERLGRALEAKLPQIESQHLPGAVEECADRRQFLMQLLAHPDGLGTLAGKQEGDLGHRR